jgi:hypothetical protein
MLVALSGNAARSDRVPPSAGTASAQSAHASFAGEAVVASDALNSAALDGQGQSAQAIGWLLLSAKAGIAIALGRCPARTVSEVVVRRSPDACFPWRRRRRLLISSSSS